MTSFCKLCMRPKGEPYHQGALCDMAELSNGRIVHAKRIDVGGDLHDRLGKDLKVVNRWIKK